MGASKEREILKKQSEDDVSLSSRKTTVRVKETDEKVRQGSHLGFLDKPESNNSYVRLQVKREPTKDKTQSENHEPESRAM